MNKRVIFLTLPILMSACSSAPPDNLGLTGGLLALCPDSPNCVSSLAPKTDSTHYIEPFRYSGDRAAARSLLLELLASWDKESVKIIDTTDDYIRTEFRTRIMRFTDDVEFYLPADEKLIHLRSASRVGYGDMGTNRKRMEQVREAFNRHYQ